jgi:pyridoxamine 5'-phosphate oxidase
MPADLSFADAERLIPPSADPIALFETWLAEAAGTEPNDPNAMTVATATPEGRPSARIVLLKGVDGRGFVFYTNKQGRKGAELAANPHAALLFHWKTLGRQVRVEGPAEDVTDAEADTYFATRARVSRLGALASDQSRPLPSRAVLERRLAELDACYPGEAIPRPPHWSGYRVIPERIEFWQTMPYRLHDRRLYTRVGTHPDLHDGNGWVQGALYP